MEEHNCIYVGSRGIQKSCDIIVNSIDALINIDFTKIKDNTIIYVKPDFFKLFKEIVKTVLKNKIILVSGDSDYIIPLDFFESNNDFLNFIDNPNIIHWFCQNCTEMGHLKITKIPIGLDYHTMSRPNNLGWGDIKTPIDQEKELIEVKKIGFLPFWERKPLCYSNFHFFINSRFGNDRLDAIHNINKNLVYFEPMKLPRLETWLKQTGYAFVICPHGNGLDTHRVYEALCLGCIPIVRQSNLDELFEGLPVLIVKKWNDVTESLLTDTMKHFRHQDLLYKKLTLKYWVDLIKGYRE